VAKGTISTWSCDPGANSFQTTADYILGPGGEQETELSVSVSVSGGATTVAWQHTNVYAAGKLLATYDGTGKGLHFYLDDPLGTRRSQTDGDGKWEQYCASLPFGDGLTCTGSTTTPTEHHFTGKERDSESGNDYFEARYYSSAMGRFLSPDWSAKAEPVPYAKLDNPQSLNLYTYALNNPLRNIDKDGHCDSSANATANTKCQDVKDLHVNDAMKQKIKQTEGLPGTKGDPALKVYKDGAGNLTVGWGHKVTAADGLKLGDTIKTDQAQKMFDSDLSSKESSVASALTNNGGHQFSQGEFNALVDLTYNAGPGALTTSMSPSLMKDMNAGDYTGMSGQLRYTKDSAGNVEPGLVTRSDDRKDIFLGADPQ
jgi:RHS repeat-associated protein